MAACALIPPVDFSFLSTLKYTDCSYNLGFKFENVAFTEAGNAFKFAAYWYMGHFHKNVPVTVKTI